MKNNAGVFKRLNYATTEGVLVLGARIDKSGTVARLYMTDLVSSIRTFIDLEKCELLGQNDVKITPHELLILCKLIKNEQLSMMEKVKMAILEG